MPCGWRALALLGQKQIEDLRLGLRPGAQDLLHILPEPNRRFLAVRSHDILEPLLAAVLLRIHDAGHVVARPHEGPIRQPERRPRQRVRSTSLQALLARSLGVHEALVPGVLGEVRVNVVLHGQGRRPRVRSGLALLVNVAVGAGGGPSARRGGVADPDREEAKLRVPEPEPREERTCAEALHQGPQRRAHVRVVGGQRHRRVPSPDLEHEAEPLGRLDRPLQRVAVLASEGHVFPHVADGAAALPDRGLTEKVLILAHEAQKGRRTRDAVGARADPDLHEVRGKRHAVVQLHPAIVPRRAVEAHVEHPRAQDP
mmetsp:Transcript_118648/g.343143  ORF Transcript_118648/g.343143 Transcript_118648/m.343143 type:complete len:314 (+) Transcript_118648:399-1340(+)